MDGQDFLKNDLPGNPPISLSNSFSYEKYEQTANFLRERTLHRPKIAIIAGSGLGDLGNILQQADIFDYHNIPNFPVSTVAGHAGRLIFGLLGPAHVPVVCMQGRFHLYEGYSQCQITFPIRIFKLLGIEILLVTNAAGALNLDFQVGDIVLIKDHINFAGFSGISPLCGVNDERWGRRFPPMNDAYDKGLRTIARQLASQCHFEGFFREGTYCMVGGPMFETCAEARMLRNAGGDVVGMSTVSEVVVARHCGLAVLGFSLVTNIVIQDETSTETANHQEVLQVGIRRAKAMQELVSGIVTKLAP